MTEIIYKYKCDCCQKEYDHKLGEFTLPILYKNPANEFVGIDKRTMDICDECADKFMKLYYKIANENGSTGFFAC